MVRQIISCFLILFCFISNAQQYVGKKGSITFFSEAPIENIQAINNKVGAVYNESKGEIVFSLKIKDFIFPKKLMQEHFNENYLESDIFPISTFQGKIIKVLNNDSINVEGDLNIHGRTNKVNVSGFLFKKDRSVSIKANFPIKLEDYNIKIPKIVMYNIAEVIDISVSIKLDRIE
tara:strand:- start:72 stop:599 length:528 start_codon:yes stop_codon:yes gene_type:complete